MAENRASDWSNVLMAPTRGGMSIVASHLALVAAGATECIFDIGNSSEGLITTTSVKS